MSYYENEDLVECDYCYTQYKYPISPTQADGCACELINKETNRFIYCSYGSQYDTYKYKVDKKSILMKKQDNVILCDICIEKFIKNKEIVKEENINDYNLIDVENIEL